MLRIGAKRIGRVEWRSLPYAGADHVGWRRLAAAVLLKGATDAHGGDGAALVWLYGPQARTWAQALDLPDWPPEPCRLGSHWELQRRARVESCSETRGEDRQ